MAGCDVMVAYSLRETAVPVQIWTARKKFQIYENRI